MGNYLKMADKQRIQALLELGWSYRRIQRETGVRRERIARYDPRRDPKAAKVPTGPVACFWQAKSEWLKFSAVRPEEVNLCEYETYQDVVTRLPYFLEEV